jgi:hypothetical protein
MGNGQLGIKLSAELSIRPIIKLLNCQISVTRSITQNPFSAASYMALTARTKVLATR